MHGPLRPDTDLCSGRSCTLPLSGRLSLRPLPQARSAPSFAVLLNLLLLAAVLYFHVLAPMLAPAEVAPPPAKKCLLGLFCR